MMVVDASAALLWFIERPASAAARSLLAQQAGQLNAPVTLLLEAQYVLTKRHLRGLLPRTQIAPALAALSSAVSFATVDETLIAAASIIALQGGGHPANVHDCVYVALALEMGVGLVTADLVQAALARSLGLAVSVL